jgi:2-polyprenyl-6-methoxyphenol hydroxylase-like FAD-dependent oxidoreductase
MDVSEKSTKHRAIVIGGSIAGLFVGAFLRRIGWQVDIYERSSIELIGRGVGIFATHLELLEALDKCGAGTVDIGVIVYKRITFDRSGKAIAEKPQLQIVPSWDRLRQVLLKAIDRQRYHFGHVFERVEQDGSSVHIYFANGRSERADLLVGCDGFRSGVRTHLAPEVQPIYSGYYIWRGAPNESDLSPETRRTMSITSTGLLLPTTPRASRSVNASSRTRASLACSSVSVSRPMTIARSRNCYRALKASWIGLQSRISSKCDPNLRRLNFTLLGALSEGSQL